MQGAEPTHRDGSHGAGCGALNWHDDGRGRAKRVIVRRHSRMSAPAEPLSRKRPSLDRSEPHRRLSPPHVVTAPPRSTPPLSPTSITLTSLASAPASRPALNRPLSPSPCAQSSLIPSHSYLPSNLSYPLVSCPPLPCYTIPTLVFSALHLTHPDPYHTSPSGLSHVISSLRPLHPPAPYPPAFFSAHTSLLSRLPPPPCSPYDPPSCSPSPSVSPPSHASCPHHHPSSNSYPSSPLTPLLLTHRLSPRRPPDDPPSAFPPPSPSPSPFPPHHHPSYTHRLIPSPTAYPPPLLSRPSQPSLNHDLEKSASSEAIPPPMPSPSLPPSHLFIASPSCPRLQLSPSLYHHSPPPSPHAHPPLLPISPATLTPPLLILPQSPSSSHPSLFLECVFAAAFHCHVHTI